MNFTKTLARMLQTLGFGYFVECKEWDALHWSVTLEDAIEWVACYPASARLEIFKASNGAIVASRGI